MYLPFDPATQLGGTCPAGVWYLLSGQCQQERAFVTENNKEPGSLLPASQDVQEWGEGCARDTGPPDEWAVGTMCDLACHEKGTTSNTQGGAGRLTCSTWGSLAKEILAMEWDAMHSSCPFTSPSSTSTMPAREAVRPRQPARGSCCPAPTTSLRSRLQQV